METARPPGAPLRVTLDELTSKEVRQLAIELQRSHDELIRTLLEYGIQVARQVEEQRLSRPEGLAYSDPDLPGVVDIEARWRELSHDELVEIGYLIDVEEAIGPED